MNLSDLQIRLKKFKLDAFLVSRNNLFIDQDIRDDENLIMQLTGFTGSAGVLLIQPDKSFLFVDGRYELQAPRQTNPKEITVICTTKISVHQWVAQNLQGKKIGYNPWCWSVQDILKFHQVEMKAESEFLPFLQSANKADVTEYSTEFCGQTREEKVTNLANHIAQNNLQAYFISSADSVSWLLNLRSNALPETPVFRAFALIDQQKHVWIFADSINTDKINAKLTFLPISEIPARLKKFKKQNLGADFETTAVALYELASDYHINLCNTTDFCQISKAIKNECELQGIRRAHIRDGIAMCKFLYWLEHNWQGKTELDISAKLHEFRSKQKYFVSESFSTIAAFGSNGANIHYTPSSETNKLIEEGNLLLLDSGAQYKDGTTDVTRTIPIGTISPQMSEDFTLVLKSHIALSAAIFPTNTTGARLDALARNVLWKEGKNYNHGTGHGVGCFLNVHEGPQYISNSCNKAFSAGQITSIEPGYYLENQYGVRIENLVEISSAQYEGFLKFKNLTLVPIDSRAINKYLLTDEERAWLNQYHSEVFKQISPHLNAAEKEWLEQSCAPL